MDRRDLLLLLPKPVRTLPADLAAVVCLTVLGALFATVPGINETPFRVVFGLPFVLFLPGYAFVAALFPEAGESPRPDGHPDGRIRNRSIDLVERAALSFGMSIALVPFVGLALNLASVPLTFGPVLLGLGGFTLVCSAVAAVRRRRLPDADRFVLPYRVWLADARAVVESSDRRTTALHVALALSILLALGTMTLAIAVPQNGERFTDFHLLTEDEDGELVAANYPETFELDEPQSLYVAVQNNEQETVEYTVVIQLERVETGDDEATVIEREELSRFGTTVADGETRHHERGITPTMVGEDLRLTFLLYQGDPPSEPTRENSYRNLHIWIDVVEQTD